MSKNNIDGATKNTGKKKKPAPKIRDEAKHSPRVGKNKSIKKKLDAKTVKAKNSSKASPNKIQITHVGEDVKVVASDTENSTLILPARARTVLSLSKISKSYIQGKSKLTILNDCSLNLCEGEIVALVGPSGSGKTTLLQIAGLLDVPDAGNVIVNGVDLSNASDALRTHTRMKELGFIYQFHHLLPEFSAIENIVIPQLIAGISPKLAKQHAHELLKYLGLANREQHRPGELSGGEQQRVAIARALVNKPLVLLADEPTGNLDPGTAKIVFDLLVTTAKAAGVAVLMVTHNVDLAKKADRRISLNQGKVVGV